MLYKEKKREMLEHVIVFIQHLLFTGWIFTLYDYRNLFLHPSLILNNVELS